MSSLATAVVFHPSLTRSVKLWSTTVGRDKTYRLIQYFSRFIAFHLIARGQTDLAARFNALKSALGSGRKLMRLFKPIEHLQAALKAVASAEAPVEQFTTIGRQLSYFGYLSLDMIVWLNAIKFLRLDADKAKQINKTSQRFWLVGIAFSIINGLAKSGRLGLSIKKLKEGTSEKQVIDEADRKVQIKTLAKARDATRYQLIIDGLDIWFPITGLELASLNDSTLGIFGVVTSVMALRTNWAKTA
ncbi:peroxisomal biogenesis factor [Clavulina sp. PMI_390]|nr:peroxisomal biogenesis factor [Clavulina sp. PMI_390]